MSNEISRTFVVTIAGPCLLMHNGQLADPLNPHAKALKAFTSKKKKSDDKLIDSFTVVFPLPSKDPLLSHRKLYDFSQAYGKLGKDDVQKETDL